MPVFDQGECDQVEVWEQDAAKEHRSEFNPAFYSKDPALVHGLHAPPSKLPEHPYQSLYNVGRYITVIVLNREICYSKCGWTLALIT